MKEASSLTYPTRALISRDWEITSKPSTSACPLEGGRSPKRILRRVDFPAPLGPKSPTAPGGRLKLLASNARLWP